VRSYRSVITQQISPVIGNTRLDKLTPIGIRKVLSVMDRNGRSSTYQRNAHSIMAAALTDAEREGRIHRNPVELVQAPLKAVTKLDMLTADETRRLLELFSNSPDAYLWATFLLTGGRRGEVIGLEWDRVGDVLDLSWQLQRIGQGVTVPANYERRHIQGGLWWTRPKSRAGWREVPLVQPLRGILAEWRAAAPSNPWGLVFTRTAEDGRQIPLDPDYISRAWPIALREAGVTRKIRLHDARHTAVDLLYAAGIPEADIKEIVGHSTVEMSRSYRSKQNQVRLRAALELYSTSLGYPNPA
jgi:integrase